jgi:hypothetical protein
LYGTDGVNAKNDALSYASIVAGDNLPHVDITNVSAVTSGVLTVTGTVFSGFANVTGGVRAAVFDPASFDLAGADQYALASFVNANGTDLGITSDQYAVGSFTDFSLSTYFSNIDAGYTTGSLVDGSTNYYGVAVSAMDTTGNVGVGVNFDPLAGVPSLSFRTRAAIASLADGTYTSSATLIYNGTTINSGSGVDTFSPGGYIIGTDINGRKYMTSHVGKSFGVFDLGTTSFTIAFVISTKGFTSHRLTYGVNPVNGFNFHFPSGIYPLGFPVSGLASSQYTNYRNADYCLFFVSFNQSTQKVTTILRTNTNHSHQITVTPMSMSAPYGYSSTPASSRTFTLATDNTEDPIRVYDMLVFPGEYMTEDRATYPIFGIIEDYVNTEYGIVIP